MGLDTLAAALCEERDTLEDVYEPFLIQLGFLKRTPRGRVATTGREYFKEDSWDRGIPPPFSLIGLPASCQSQER